MVPGLCLLPLGGSRVKTKGRLVFNLFVVWSLTGIWHGASWNFVFWGLLYFCLLTFEKLTGIPQKFTSPWAKGAYRVFTLLCVIIGWVFFRAETMTAGTQFVKDMFGLGGIPFTSVPVTHTWLQYRFFYLGALVCSTPIFRRAKAAVERRSKKLAAAVEYAAVPVYLLLLIWSISYIMIGSHNPFIYFNF